MSTERKLSLGQKIGYGVGDTGINFWFNAGVAFMLVFYTDGLGLSPVTAGSILFVARAVDAITDPLMGWITDRTQTKMGKFRPFILAGAIPMAVMGVLTFTDPGLSPSQTLIYAYATYILYGITYTIISIPYSGLTAAVTHNPKERTELTAFRMVGAFTGSLAIQVGMAAIINAYDQSAQGYQMAMVLFGVVGVACLWTCVVSTRELPAPAHSRSDSLAQSWSAMKSNWPLWASMGAFLFSMLGTTIRGAVVIYYFTYVVGVPDLIPQFFGMIGIAMLAGIAITPMVAARIGKRRTYIVGALISMVIGTGLFFVPPDNVTAIFAVAFFALFFAALPMVMGWALLPDTVEYGEWQSGVRAEGTIYAATSFCHKLAMATGGGLAGLLLGSFGYVAKADIQPDSALLGITLMLTLIPAAFSLLGVIAISFYRLDEDQFAEIEAELATRRSAAAVTT